jgi:hypothetical protein
MSEANSMDRRVLHFFEIHMDDKEISKALALAIGYLPEHIRDDRVLKGRIQVFRQPDGFIGSWFPFSYKAGNVIWPIAVTYDCFPYRLPHGGNWIVERIFGNWESTAGKTPEKAVALAVIKYHTWCKDYERRHAMQQNTERSGAERPPGALSSVAFSESKKT